MIYLQRRESMNINHKLSYMVLGGLLMLIGIIATVAFMPSLVAQNSEIGVFDQIYCRTLFVTDDNGNAHILLRVVERGNAVADNDESFGLMAMTNMDRSSVAIAISGQVGGPQITLSDKNHNELVSIHTAKYGGSVVVKSGNSDGAALLGIGSDNGGFCGIEDAYGNLTHFSD